MSGKHGLDADEPQNKRVKLDAEAVSASQSTHGPSQQEQEIAVGITAFVSPDQSGFTCTVKQRYTDFLVNEILPDGEVLHLKELPPTSLARPRETVKAENADDKPEPAIAEPKSSADKPSEPKAPDTLEAPSPEAKAVENAEISEDDQKVLHSIFGEATTSKILHLYSAVLTNPGRKPRDQPNVNSEVIAEKSLRTQAHITVRQVFKSKLETATLQERPGVIAIRAAQIKGASGVRVQQSGQKSRSSQPKGRLGWDELGGEYLHFTLHKEKKDTMEVLYFMASQFKVNIDKFQFAGTKDRRGVTVQRVSLFRVHADRLINLNRLAKGWLVSDFVYKKHGLELGELVGNEFCLTLRGCHVADEPGLDIQQRLAHAKASITAAAESLRSKGFLNYYGLQRFGTFSTGTHMIGMKMLKGDLEGAINSILAYDSSLLDMDAEESKVPQENISRAQAIKRWRDTGELSERMPRRFQAEATIMEYLSKRDHRTKQLIQSRDWQGALMRIQRNLRLMYVHAYQSLVWNTVVGHRWSLFGSAVVAGDLVIVGEKDNVGKPPKDEVDEDGEPIFHPALGDSAASAAGDFVRARPLTEEEANSGRYDIFDIVLPLPGFDVVYPANEVGDFYTTFMGSELGGGMDPHDMRRRWKDISLSGSYRKILARPGHGFDVQVRACSNPLEQLVETDVERLSKALNNGSSVKEDSADIGSPSASSEEDASIVVVMKFQLGSSQYATMALRELTKGGATQFRPDFSAAR